MLLSAKTRLTLWAVAALAVNTTAGAVLGYTYYSAGSGGNLLSIIVSSLVLAVTTIIILRHQLNRCLAPLTIMAQRCHEITINNLDNPLTTANRCKESQYLASEYNDMLKRLEDEARRIRQFSGDASHELRTPLTILRGETEVALRWAKSCDEFRTTLQSNMEEIDRMGRILEDLLVLAKSEYNKLPLSIKTISISDIMQELYIQAQSLAEAKQIQINLHHHVEHEILLDGDDLRLRQLFVNIITNAIRYTGDNGTIDINISSNNDHVHVSISDNGIGITPEHLPHIFERFYRTDEARNRTSGGTGLGLAIVQSIIDAHNGEIKVTSAPGKGSTFLIIIPLKHTMAANDQQNK